MKPFAEAIGDLELAQKLFGDKQEITWLNDEEWAYTRMTITRDGQMSWKDEDKWDWDTTLFTGTYTLTGTEEEFTITGTGKSEAYYDAYKDTASAHRDQGVTQAFSSERFTGPDFSVSYR